MPIDLTLPTAIESDDDCTGDDDMWGDAPTVLGTAGADTFVFDTSTQFSTATGDEIKDAGVGGVTDTLRFEGVADGAGDDIADLEAIATVTDDGTDVTVTIDGTGANVEIEGIGDGTIDTVQELHDLAAVDVVVVNP